MKILSELDKSGLKTTIYGNNWPEGIFKKHSINGAVGFNDILKLMTRSKIVLNIGNYPDGSHERVFSAMLNGALMLSDYNSYLAEIFEEDKEIAFYRWLDLEVLPEKTAYLLSHPEKMKEIALKGKRKAEKEHTWKSRAESLLKIVNGFKAARG
jgi:spore maturation protein CgeB